MAYQAWWFLHPNTRLNSADLSEIGFGIQCVVISLEIYVDPTNVDQIVVKTEAVLISDTEIKLKWINSRSCSDTEIILDTLYLWYYRQFNQYCTGWQVNSASTNSVSNASVGLVSSIINWSYPCRPFMPYLQLTWWQWPNRINLL